MTPLIVTELKVALFMLLLVSRFAAPLGKTRFSAPVPAGATPPAQLLPMLQFGFCAPVQVNVCARPGEANPPSASNRRKSTRDRIRILQLLLASRVPSWERAHVVISGQLNDRGVVTAVAEMLPDGNQSGNHVLGLASEPLGSKPYFLRFSHRFFREMPSSSAARWMSPSVSSSVSRMYARSASTSVRPFGKPNVFVSGARPGAASSGPNGGKSDRLRTGPSVKIMARSITLRSSRTLPGQSHAASVSSAGPSMRSTFFLNS